MLWKAEYHHFPFLDEVLIGIHSSIAFCSSDFSSYIYTFGAEFVRVWSDRESRRWLKHRSFKETQETSLHQDYPRNQDDYLAAYIFKVGVVPCIERAAISSHHKAEQALDRVPKEKSCRKNSNSGYMYIWKFQERCF